MNDRVFIWVPDYSVGHTTMDTHHQKLLTICKKLEDFIGGTSTGTSIHSILDDLAKYTKLHFRTEELLLEAIHYPGLTAQKEEHRLYESNLVEFQYAAALNIIDIDSFYKYLTDWWMVHILEDDMKYAPSLAQR